MEEIFENIDSIITLSFAFLSVIFAWLSWWYSKLAYQRNQFMGKVSMNRAFWDFWSWDQAVIHDLIIFSFVNTGHRKWTIKSVYLELENNKTIFFAMMPMSIFINPGLPNFPCVVEETGEISFTVSYEWFVKVIQESCVQKKYNLKYICFSDSTGKNFKYRIKKRHWKELF